MASRWWRGLVLTVAACVLASPAPAKILRATSILPPGESGFVSPTGVTDGTGSPHLYDQQQPFINFLRKSAMFGQHGPTTNPAPGVTIVRDHYGVPSVS